MPVRDGALHVVSDLYIKEVFDLRPRRAHPRPELLRPVYQQTATYGHFGRELPDLK
ncbi:methionine adenosyltransferase domain-containing protein [Streptomyces sp. CA-210063]|uniref:methionine adenosyltransferase domain-containing protein n=1 Tax=Streptomyces sp. CA-210063 TaxID=2801029 RepID=UPI00214C7D60|nr:methionine adenosyltransferase domain-containing protein [Streptomyces sp. CA-210063]UUU28497.1 methionine adenosyltransferase domain-containing protein [Streptomyces sp. CA-210063]